MALKAAETCTIHEWKACSTIINPHKYALRLGVNSFCLRSELGQTRPVTELRQPNQFYYNELSELFGCIVSSIWR